MSFRLPVMALSILVASLASALAHPPAILNSAAEQAVAGEVEAFRAALADAVRRKDAARLQAMFTQSFVHTSGTGRTQGRDAHIATLLAGEPSIETAHVHDLVIRIPNDWTAIATGVAPLKTGAGGKASDHRWTAVFVRTETHWAVAASHLTRLEKR